MPRRLWDISEFSFKTIFFYLISFCTIFFILWRDFRFKSKHFPLLPIKSTVACMFRVNHAGIQAHIVSKRGISTTYVIIACIFSRFGNFIKLFCTFHKTRNKKCFFTCIPSSPIYKRKCFERVGKTGEKRKFVTADKSGYACTIFHIVVNYIFIVLWPIF